MPQRCGHKHLLRWLRYVCRPLKGFPSGGQTAMRGTRIGTRTRKLARPVRLPALRWRVPSATQVQQDHAEENHQAARQNGPDPRPLLEHHIANTQSEEDFGLLHSLDV